MSNSDKSIPNTSGASEEAATLAAELCPVRAAYDAAAQALSEALERKSALTDRAATMKRARDAAQAEVNAARQQWSRLLREADDTLTRDIQKLRAAETSALTLVEEYAAMRQEIGVQITAMEVTVAELAEVAIDKRTRVIELASREAFDALMAQAGDGMAVAYVLHRHATLAPIPVRMQPSDEQVVADFLGQIERQLKVRADSISNAASAAIGVRGLTLDGVDLNLVASPVRRAMVLKENERSLLCIPRAT
ncbi:hypothetical protein [Xanthomonas arboricola]|uniref:hypothetical protein n=1 Tax=Xanthomonas arboricola TaxID=56448 RepID=UPI000464D9F9|nr:hypothetical protein [Xanthomonas arboricola]